MALYPSARILLARMKEGTRREKSRALLLVDPRVASAIRNVEEAERSDWWSRCTPEPATIRELITDRNGHIRP